MAWQDELVPTDLTYEDNGTQKLLRDHPFVRNAPDLSTFVKQSYDAHREVGARVPIKIERVRNQDGTFGPKIEAIEQWRKDHLPKLYDAGILDRPPTKPEDYEIKKPEQLHDGVNWSDERAGKFAALGIKHGISKAAMHELLDLHRDAVGGVAAIYKANYDETMLGLKREYGDKFDERLEQAKRLNNIIFKSPEDIKFFEETGLGNHPILTSILMRLAPYAQNDSSLVDSLKTQGQVPPDQIESERAKVRTELADIMSNPQNPRHAAYLRNDPEVNKYITGLYERLYGKGEIEIIPGTGKIQGV